MPKKRSAEIIALERMMRDAIREAEPVDQEAANAEMARMLKDWRGDMPVGTAAVLLGIPKRTLDGIEQGRGFRYPRLLTLAIMAIKSGLKGY